MCIFTPQLQNNYINCKTQQNILHTWNKYTTLLDWDYVFCVLFHLGIGKLVNFEVNLVILWLDFSLRSKTVRIWCYKYKFSFWKKNNLIYIFLVIHIFLLPVCKIG